MSSLNRRSRLQVSTQGYWQLKVIYIIQYTPGGGARLVTCAVPTLCWPRQLSRPTGSSCTQQQAYGQTNLRPSNTVPVLNLIGIKIIADPDLTKNIP